MPLIWALLTLAVNWSVIVPLTSATARAGLDDGRVLCEPACLEDVEVGERLLAVDRDVEDALARRGQEGLGEVEPDLVGRAGRQAGDDVGERRRVSVGLVDRLGAGSRMPATLIAAVTTAV